MRNAANMRRVKWRLLPVLIMLVFIIGGVEVWASPSPVQGECLVPPSFDRGVGELYFCSPVEGERHMIEYARRSFVEGGLEEDVWVNFRGIFADQVWVNVGARESNDTSLPAWEVLADLVERMQDIKTGSSSGLQAFLGPIEAAVAVTEENRALKRNILKNLRASVTAPKEVPLRAVLYHVHLKPTQEIEDRSLLPINHSLSIPSHTDLLYAPRLSALIPGGESKIAVAAGIWTYNWDKTRGARFVTELYDGPANAPFPMKFAHAYTRFAITEYHRQGFNNPAKVTSERVSQYIRTLKPTGTVLRFGFATDWEAFRGTLIKPASGE